MDVNPLGQAKLNKDKFSTYFKANDKETDAEEQEEYRKQENNIIDKHYQVCYYLRQMFLYSFFLVHVHDLYQ